MDFPSTHKKISKLSLGVEALGTRFLPFIVKLNLKHAIGRYLFTSRCMDYSEKD